ncbi:MAG: hypothetical protein OEZ13_13275 [Spirochaetia bacterium]|nr:hypothetical protein [Spirochaetia bacterium]
MQKICIFIFFNLILSAIILPQEIKDAPLDDIVFEDKENSTSKYFRYRLFTISYIDYNHLKSDLGSETSILGQFFEKRGARQEANGEFLFKIPGKFSFKTDVLAQYSTSFSESTPLFKSGYHDYVRLNEFFIEALVAENLSFLAGKYRRIYTPGLFQNPLDLHNPVSALPGQPAKREGAYLAQINYFSDFKNSAFSSGEFTAAYLPMFYQNKYGIVSEKKDSFFTEETQAGVFRLSKERVKYSIKDSGAFLRLYLNLYKGDFNLIYYYLNRQNQGGISYATYLKKYLELHGETIFYEKSRYQFTAEQPKKNIFFDALIGSRIEYSDYTGFIIEYIWRDERPRSIPQNMNEKLTLFSALLNESRAADFLTPLRDYLVLSFYIREIKDLYSLTLNAIYGLRDNETFSSLRFDIKSGDTAMLSLTAAAALGDSGSFYGGMIPFDYKLSCEALISF